MSIFHWFVHQLSRLGKKNTNKFMKQNCNDNKKKEWKRNGRWLKIFNRNIKKERKKQNWREHFTWIPEPFRNIFKCRKCRSTIEEREEDRQMVLTTSSNNSNKRGKPSERLMNISENMDIQAHVQTFSSPSKASEKNENCRKLLHHLSEFHGRKCAHGFGTEIYSFRRCSATTWTIF